MGNDNFGKNNRGGRNDFFGEAYGNTSRVSAGRAPVRDNTAREVPQRETAQREAGGSGGGRSGSYGGRSGKARRRGLPLALMIVIDVVLAAVLLGIFYVTNYEMHGETGPIESLPVPSWMISSAPATAAVDVTVSPSGTETEAMPTVTAADPNDWGAKFTGKFTDGAIENTENTYRSKNINIKIDKVQKDNATYFVADIYIAELKYFRTAFPVKADKMGGREFTDVVAKENSAILAINGDHCVDNPSLIIRNGLLYQSHSTSADSLVMNYDGSMQAFSPSQFDLNEIKTKGAYQVWGFGPMLLKDGKAMTEFNSTLESSNPRTAVGYYEPGHYCFVVVDGRQPGYSDGYTLTQLSSLFADLGCVVAYNMDGGRSAEMAFNGELISHPMDGRRSTTDILYIGE